MFDNDIEQRGDALQSSAVQLTPTSSTADEVQLPLTPTRSSLSATRDANTSPAVSSGPSGIPSANAMEIANLVPRPQNLRLPCHFTRDYRHDHNFFPRDDITRIMDNALLPPLRAAGSPSNSPNLRMLFLHGLGGIGKTEAALEYALSRKSSFEGIFIMNASSVASLESDFSRLSVALGLESTGSQNDPTISREYVMKWLENPVNPSFAPETPQVGFKIVNWLMLFDNADQSEVLFDFWPTEGQGSVLVTCRDILANDSSLPYARDNSHEVDTLSVEDSARFLRRLVPNSDTAENLKYSIEIAKCLDGIPLAITQMAAIMRKKRLSFREFLTEYKKPNQKSRFHSLDIHAHDSPHFRKRYEHTIASVWALESLTQESFALLTVISLLAPDRIEPQLFFSDINTGTLLCVGIPSYPSNQNDYYDARLKLLEACMVRYVGTPDRDGSLRIHRLVQDVTVLRSQECCDFPEIFSHVVKMVSRLWPYIFNSDEGAVGRAHRTGRWVACEMAFPHISHLHERYGNVVWDKALSPKAQKEFAHLLLEAS